MSEINDEDQNIINGKIPTTFINVSREKHPEIKVIYIYIQEINQINNTKKKNEYKIIVPPLTFQIEYFVGKIRNINSYVIIS
jgi:hypothetical protein